MSLMITGYSSNEVAKTVPIAMPTARQEVPESSPLFFFGDSKETLSIGCNAPTAVEERDQRMNITSISYACPDKQLLRLADRSTQLFPFSIPYERVDSFVVLVNHACNFVEFGT